MSVFQKVVRLFAFSCSVFTAHSMEALGRAQSILCEHKIPYKVKTTSRSNQSLGWGRGTSRTQFGSLGTNAAEEYCYEILVEKAQRENARGVLGGRL